MKQKISHYYLIGILILVLGLHLFFTLHSETIPYDAHFLFRETAAIQTTGIPFTIDPLSYQGRTHVFSILFPYFATLLSLILPNMALLLVLQLLFSLALLILVFRVTFILYKRYWISILLTLLAATSTILFYASRQTANATQLFVLLYLLILISFFKLPKLRASSLFAIFVVLATLTSPLVLVLVPGSLLYLLILYVEKMQQRKDELEVLGFSVVFIVWYHLIIYKKLLVTFGSGAVWQSIPRALLSEFFQSLTLPVFIQLIGLLPLLLGIYGVYEGVFIKKKRSILFLVALTLASGLLLIFGFLPVVQGLAFTALNFILLAGYGLQGIITFFNKTKFTSAKSILIVGVVALTIVFFIPTLFPLQDATGVTRSEQNFLRSLDLHNATILGHIQEGHELAYYTGQKNFYDTSFIFAPNSEERYIDAQTIFRSRSLNSILELTDYYQITHIYISPLTRKTYDTDTFFFESDPCFSLVAADKEYSIYEITCSLDK